MIVINQVFVLFLLIVVGFIIKKLKVVSDGINKEISSLVINVALPAFILTSMNQSFTPEILKNSMLLILISGSVYLFAIIFSKLYTRAIGYEGSKKDIYEYIIVFANVGYMGYPVVSVALGDIGVFYAAVYNLFFNLLVWTYGVHLITRSSENKEAKRNFLNPGLVALIIGFMTFLFSIELPEPIFKTLKMVGSTTTPLSMMFIGFVLADVDLRELYKDRGPWLLSAVRLLALPLIVYFALKGIGLKDHMLIVPVLLTAMPAAANTSILASRYDGDVKMASKATFLSTLLSVLTIPVILSIL